MNPTSDSDLRTRFHLCTTAWKVTVDEVIKTPASLLAMGHRGSRPVVLKVIRERGDEWDLHHDNILFDDQRGWLAIDAKGVVGERAYEVGAAFRNPIDHPERFLDRATIERRVGQLSAALSLSEQRVHYWAFVQAVLAAIWELEDDGRLTNGVHWVALASAMDSWLEL